MESTTNTTPNPRTIRAYENNASGFVAHVAQENGIPFQKAAELIIRGIAHPNADIAARFQAGLFHDLRPTTDPTILAAIGRVLRSRRDYR